ncbi:hypothetical protein POREN0001_1930 [Porphyromonas endodontalis ATCC 35406]|uniref:Uncharacterized protein n=1 Tax=Porphyromonas endodontalis (strain ATCC 35406 / DSM 24491 / JCM 8526 / CCUG 16442 / BCRC 14492 / NCTC 13058 / HG 370) TaxID=553175 RepID=C3JCR3_POREA|nr:hypothetical protein POREN0001_1930 [Porphyromonas endodontalis ATCC 35406]
MYTTFYCTFAGLKVQGAPTSVLGYLANGPIAQLVRAPDS